MVLERSLRLLPVGVRVEPEAISTWMRLITSTPSSSSISPRASDESRPSLAEI